MNNNHKISLFRYLAMGIILLAVIVIGYLSFSRDVNAQDKGQQSSQPATAGVSKAGAELVLPRPKLAPAQAGDMSLLQIVSLRHSTREFDANKAISEQVLGDLLYCAFGITHEQNKRSIPTAMNKQELEVLAITANGVYRYEAANHSLRLLLDEDVRCGQFATAALTLAYAAPASPYAGMHAGSSYQNTALYAASIGLGNVVAGSPLKAYAEKLPLSPNYELIILQAFGWPKETKQ